MCESWSWHPMGKTKKLTFYSIELKYKIPNMYCIINYDMTHHPPIGKNKHNILKSYYFIKKLTKMPSIDSLFFNVPIGEKMPIKP